MPRISDFYGIAIYMHPNDHPPPHFHVRQAKQPPAKIDPLR